MEIAQTANSFPGLSDNIRSSADQDINVIAKIIRLKSELKNLTIQNPHSQNDLADKEKQYAQLNDRYEENLEVARQQENLIDLYEYQWFCISEMISAGITGDLLIEEIEKLMRLKQVPEMEQE